MVDYASLFSNKLPRSVSMPDGSSAQVKYIFSITNAVPEVINAQNYLAAIRAGLESGGPNALAAYPPPTGHNGLRELVAERLAANRGFNASPDDVFISDGAGGAINIILDSFINPGDAVLVEELPTWAASA
jgi:aspartate aminotransferase